MKLGVWLIFDVLLFVILPNAYDFLNVFKDGELCVADGYNHTPLPASMCPGESDRSFSINESRQIGSIHRSKSVSLSVGHHASPFILSCESSYKKAPESSDPGAIMVEVRGRLFRAFRLGPDYAFIARLLQPFLAERGCGAS